MTPTEALNHLASILFHRSGDYKSRKVAVRLGYGNRLKVPAGIDQSNCDAGMSGGFISLWLNASELDCKAHGFTKIEGKDVFVSETISDVRITVHAQRCGSFDRLHRLKSEFCHPGNSIPFHDDIISAEFGTILDVTALGQGDEFEDRAESVLTLRVRDITVKKLPCVTYCASPIYKDQKEQETSLCH